MFDSKQISFIFCQGDGDSNEDSSDLDEDGRTKKKANKIKS